MPAENSPLKREIRFVLRILLAIITILALIFVPGIVAGNSNAPDGVVATQDDGNTGEVLAIFIPVGIIVFLAILGIAWKHSRDRRALNRVRSEFLSGGGRPSPGARPSRRVRPPPRHRPADY